MNNLILIRHSITRQVPEIDSHQWELTTEGQQRCKLLAQQIRPYGITRIITSEENKAILTGKLTADELGVPCEAAPDLDEQRRSSAPYFENLAEFQAAVHAAMQEPEKLLFGDETFLAARERFSSQIERLITRYPDQTLAIVTHGTVLSLYLGQITGGEAFSYWEKLRMPAYAVLALPEKALLEFIPALPDDT